MSGSVSGRVLKAMAIFGGVRMLQIIFGVVRTKLVAVWLGPAGVGLFGIFNGAVDTVRTLSQLGMRSSAVRDIASQPSPSSRAMMVGVVRRWGWMLGVFGAILMAAAAPLLSRWTFDDTSHTLSYIALAGVLFFLSVANAEEAVMQGLGALGSLAKASVWGAVAGLVVSVPMYYFWRLDSVVPSIIAYSLATCVATACLRPRVAGIQTPGLPETFSRGRRFIILGLYMTVADFAVQALSYVFIAWLNHRGGDTEVGFYQAGYTIVNRYVGLIFTALATEYYPRLASVVASRRRLNVYVGHEMVVILLMLLPAVAIFVALAPWLVRLLYDSQFAPIVPFITVAMAGVVLRGVSYCMSYVILAKGDGVTFLLTESLSGVAGLALNIVCYKAWGIAGLGVSYTVWYLLYVLIVGLAYRFRYRLALPLRPLLLALTVFVITGLSILLATFITPLAVLPVGIVAGIVSVGRLKRLLGRGR